jgi:hypothetical protein
MSEEVWNKVYKSDSTFFGEEPSNFALLCFNHMKTNNVKKVLELGAGQDRDTNIFCIKWNWSRSIRLFYHCSWDTG